MSYAPFKLSRNPSRLAKSCRNTSRQQNVDVFSKEYFFTFFSDFCRGHLNTTGYGTFSTIDNTALYQSGNFYLSVMLSSESTHCRTLVNFHMSFSAFEKPLLFCVTKTGLGVIVYWPMRQMIATARRASMNTPHSPLTRPPASLRLRVLWEYIFCLSFLKGREAWVDRERDKGEACPVSI